MSPKRMPRRTLIKSGLALGLLGAFTGIARAEPKVYVNSVTGIAIGGTDPVAYFTEGTNVRGSEMFQTEWNGAPWHFSSAENRDLFMAEPEKYAPQYGGYCAFAVAFGALASTVPEAWTIRNGKLYLNASLGVRADWLQDPGRLIIQANQNWPEVLN